MSDQFQQPRETNQYLRRHALWAAFLSILLEGFLFSYAIYQLAQVGFSPKNPFGYIIASFFSAALLLAVTGTVLILRRKVIQGLGIVYYSGFIPAVVTPLLYSGRGFSTAIAIGFVSLGILLMVYPREERRRPFLALIAAEVFSIAIELIKPSYRVELPVKAQIGPLVGLVLLIIFLGLFIAKEWQGLQVRSKLIISIGATSLVIVGSLTYVSVENNIHRTELDEERQLSLLLLNYSTFVNSQANAAASLAISLASREDVIELYEARDRQALLDLLTPLFTTLKNDHDIRHLYIEEPSGIVYVRVHNPASFGDDITYRRTAAVALETREPVAGVEIGPSRLGVRGVAPMYRGSRFMGMVEVGIDYDESFIQNLKSATNADYTMWVTYEAAEPAGLRPADDAPLSSSSRIFYYASTYPNILPISAEIYNQVLETGISQTIRLSDGRNELAVLVAPMLGYGERIIGIFEIIYPRTETLANIRSDNFRLLLVALLTALVSLGAIWGISQLVIIRPIEQLVAVSQRQTKGELHTRIHLSGNDEFHQLGESLNSLSDSLQDLVQELETRVTERTFDLEKAVEEVAHRSSQLESVAEVANNIATIRELPILLPRITQLISERFGYYHAGVFLLDAGKGYAVLTAANSEGGKRMLARGHRLKVGSEGIVGYVTNTGEPRVALDVGADAVYFDNPDMPDTRSEMALPLRTGKEIIGALDVQSVEPDAFTSEDVEVLTILANQIAIAIENARLFEDTHKLLAEAQIAYGKSLQEAWKIINSGWRDLRYDYKGLDVETSHELLQLPEIVEAYQTGKTAFREKSRKAPKTALAVPIKVRGNIIGTMNVQLPENRDLDADELDISEAIAERAGIAIEGAMLLQESQRRAAKEQLIGDISAKISASINMRNVLQAAVEELGRVIPGSDIVVQFQETNQDRG
jgi:GAF domain-containing protein/HAMP domain-containing protein